MIDPRAYEAMGQPLTGLRDPYFLSVIQEIQAGLRLILGASAATKVFTLPASGSGAMECAVANFVPPGAKFAVFTAGHFGDRIALMGERQGATVARCEKAWGEVFTEAEAAAFIEKEKPAVVAFVQAETSTGAYQSGQAITGAAHKAGALVIADCVTSLGAMPVEMDAVGIDIAYSCSQKGMSCPAGLSPIAVAPRAWQWLEGRTSNPASWYLDLRLLVKYFEEPHAYHHTPSPPLYYALHQGIAVVEEEGLSQRWNRHKAAGEQFVAGVTKLGFVPLVKEPADRLWHLTVVLPPAGVDEAKLRDQLLKDYDIEIAGGLGKLAGKILRIGTMGPLANQKDTQFLLDAIAKSL